MAKKYYCITCESYETAPKKTPGSLIIEIFLWCMFLVPGIIYSVWRITSRKRVCRTCASLDIVPPNSPIAQRKLKPIIGAEQLRTDIKDFSKPEAGQLVAAAFIIMIIGWLFLAVIDSSVSSDYEGDSSAEIPIISDASHAQQPFTDRKKFE